MSNIELKRDFFDGSVLLSKSLPALSDTLASGRLSESRTEQNTNVLESHNKLFKAFDDVMNNSDGGTPTAIDKLARLDLLGAVDASEAIQFYYRYAELDLVLENKPMTKSEAAKSTADPWPKALQLRLKHSRDAYKPLLDFCIKTGMDPKETFLSISAKFHDISEDDLPSEVARYSRAAYKNEALNQLKSLAPAPTPPPETKPEPVTTPEPEAKPEDRTEYKADVDIADLLGASEAPATKPEEAEERDESNIVEGTITSSIPVDTPEPSLFDIAQNPEINTPLDAVLPDPEALCDLLVISPTSTLSLEDVRTQIGTTGKLLFICATYDVAAARLLNLIGELGVDVNKPVRTAMLIGPDSEPRYFNSSTTKIFDQLRSEGLNRINMQDKDGNIVPY